MTIELNKVPLNMHELLNNLIVQIKESLNTGSISTDFQAREFEIKGDVLHITNIVYNLVDNAIKYGIESPEIVVGTSSTKKEFILQIKDNGVGISKEHQKLIFDKFYRIGNEDTSNAKGTGLGLFIVKRVITLHGGKISVDDNAPRGTTFSVQFPKKQFDEALEGNLSMSS